MQMQTNQKSKTDYCFYCNFPITVPHYELVVKCPNLNCRKLNLFPCHIIDPTKNKNDILCLKCAANFIIINCGSCGGFQAWNKSTGNFRNGMKHICQCGATSTLILCNNCQSLISIKGKKSHQLAMIHCKNCSYQFRYKICQSCHILIYKQRWDTSSLFVCPNNNCPKSNVINPYETAKMDNELFMSWRSGSDREKTKLLDITNIQKEKESCKICFSNEANMINTKCYHLAVCEKCSGKLKQQCPICRSTGGQFKKVFKS